PGLQVVPRFVCAARVTAWRSEPRTGQAPLVLPAQPTAATPLLGVEVRYCPVRRATSATGLPVQAWPDATGRAAAVRLAAGPRPGSKWRRGPYTHLVPRDQSTISRVPGRWLCRPECAATTPALGSKRGWCYRRAPKPGHYCPAQRRAPAPANSCCAATALCP